MVNERGLVDATGGVVAAPGSVRIGAMALLEPVASFVDGSMKIPANVDAVLVVQALNEIRSDYRPLSFAGDARVRTVLADGNHMGGVGGGEDKNGLAANVLEGTTGFFQNRGTSISSVPVGNRFDSSQPPKLYTEIYQTAANGDILVDENTNLPKLQWRIDDGNQPRKTVKVAPGNELSSTGTETNLDTPNPTAVDEAHEDPDVLLARHEEATAEVDAARESLRSALAEALLRN